MVRQSESPEPTDQDDRLGEAIEAYLALAESGTPPDPEAFAARYPDLRDDLVAALEGLAMVHGLVGGPASTPGGGPGGRLESGRRIAGYRIVRELGRGGMGVVYEAVHVGLERPVALKVLGTHAAPDSSGRRRFLNEARTAAGLHHTHIVPVFDVGQLGGLCYYAMQRIEGSGLDRVVRHLRRDRPNAAGSGGASGPGSGQGSAPRRSRFGVMTPFTPWWAPRGRPGVNGDGASANGHAAAAAVAAWEPAADDATSLLSATGSFTGVPAASLRRDDGPPPFDPPRGSAYYRWVADVGRQAAEALGHAHRRGVIHRDVKPSNLLVDGRGLIWVADFGLARRLADPGVSHHESLIGTPRYMSPEQARVGPVDGRTDLYSLGATLYELLTLRPPFEGRSAAELIEQIGHREPPRPRSFDPRIPRDLETIVLKLLSKRPADRYENAGELADDLRRFLAMEPVRARRISPVGRLWRFARRHPGGSAITAAAAAAVLTVSTVAYVRVVHERDAKSHAVDETRAALRQSLRHQAELVRKSSNPNRRVDGLNLIRQAADLRPEPSLAAGLRDEAVELLVQRDAEERLGFPTGRARGVTFAADGTRLAALTGAEDGDRLTFWDATRREKLVERPLRTEGPGGGRGGPGGPSGGFAGWFGTGPAVASAGPLVAVVAPGGQGVRLFDPVQGARVHAIATPGRFVQGVYATPDGQRVVTLELALPTLGRRGPGGGGGPGGPPSQPPTGPRYEVRLWEPGRDEPVATLDRWEAEPFERTGPLAAVSPDGHTVATARLHRAGVSLWSADTGEALGKVEATGELAAVALGSDNQLAVAVGGEVRLWDVESRTPLTTLTLHQSAVRFLKYGPRGSLLAVVGWPGNTVELWDTAAHAAVADLRSAEPVVDVAFAPDGQTLAVAGQGTSTAVWAVVDSAVRDRLGGFDVLTRSMAFRPDGLLALGSWRKATRFWQAGRCLHSETSPAPASSTAANASTAAAKPPATAANRPAGSGTGTGTPAARPAADDPAREQSAALAFDDHGRLLALEADALRVCETPPECPESVRVPLPDSPGAGAARFFGSVLAPSQNGRNVVIARGSQLLLWSSDAPETLRTVRVPASLAALQRPWGERERERDRDREGPRPRGGDRDRDRPGAGPGPAPAAGPGAGPGSGPGQGDRDRDRGRTRGGSGGPGGPGGPGGGRSAWRSVVVAPGGDRLYLVDVWGNLHAWALAGDQARDLAWAERPTGVTALALSPDGAVLAVGQRTGSVLLLDALKGSTSATLRGGPGESDGQVGPLAFSPDGKEVAVGSQQGAVALWSVSDPTGPLLHLPGHRGPVTALAFDAKGHALATAGSDKAVDVWDLARLREGLGRLGLGW